MRKTVKKDKEKLSFPYRNLNITEVTSDKMKKNSNLEVLWASFSTRRIIRRGS
jgi:hypothetical protein